MSQIQAGHLKDGWTPTTWNELNLYYKTPPTKVHYTRCIFSLNLKSPEHGYKIYIQYINLLCTCFGTCLVFGAHSQSVQAGRTGLQIRSYWDITAIFKVTWQEIPHCCSADVMVDIKGRSSSVYLTPQVLLLKLETFGLLDTWSVYGLQYDKLKQCVWVTVVVVRNVQSQESSW